MNKYFHLLWIVSLTVLSCQQSTTNENVSTLSGTVYYLDENQAAQPLALALVHTKEIFAQGMTNGMGQYSISFEPASEEAEFTIEASKAGYEVSQAVVLVKKGSSIHVPDITMRKISNDTLILPIDTTRVSGDAAHIEVFGNPDSHIYIQNSGMSESTILHFLVTDAQGIPVDENHKVDVQFSILNGPGGGEYLYPATVTTQYGLAYTVLNSGTVAGPVQIRAEILVNGQPVTALPIRVAIYGGLPDPDHFSISLDQANIAGRVHFGLIDNVTAFVGDRYSNPVAPGTVVYFESDYGIVAGSAQTDEMGRATVAFMSAQPLPPDPAVNPFARITAKTYSDSLDQYEISTGANLLLSDVTAAITVSPASFTYNEQNSPVQFSYSVHDIWGYPLVGNTRIHVAATDGELYGDVDISTRDTQIPGPGTTGFSFTWAPGDSLDAPQVYITITVDPPATGNGYRSTSILGNKQ